MKKTIFAICLAASLLVFPAGVSAHGACRGGAATAAYCNESSICMVDGVCNGTCTGTGSCRNYDGCNSLCDGSQICVEHGSCYGNHTYSGSCGAYAHSGGRHHGRHC